MAMGLHEIALTKDEPPGLTEASSEAAKKEYKEWEESNRVCKLAIGRTIQNHLKSGLPMDRSAKELMDAIKARYKVASNAQIGSLLQEIHHVTYDASKGVRDYIIRLMNSQTQL